MEPEIDRAPEQAKVRLELTAPGADLGYVIANAGQTPLLFGAGYRFDRHTESGWEPVRVSMLFPAWGRGILAGEDSGTMVARVPNSQPPGRYRLLTEVLALSSNGAPMRGRDEPIRIAASSEFTIAG